MTDQIALSYRVREALGYNEYHSLSHLEDDVRRIRVALSASAPFALAAIQSVPKETLGYIGNADTEDQTPVTVTLTVITTLGALREARRALWLADAR